MTTHSELVADDYPRDRDFWAVTADETVERLRYWPGASAWAGSPLFSCVDDEKAAYAAADLFEWSDSPDAPRATATQPSDDGEKT